MNGAKVTFNQGDLLYIGWVRDKVYTEGVGDGYVVEVYSLKESYKNQLWIIKPGSLVRMGWDGKTEERENAL